MISNCEILSDLHVTTLKDTEFKSFSMSHQSELVFHLIPDYAGLYKKTEITKSYDEEYNDKKSFSINDFFPFYGISLGKTTWRQVDNLGYPITIYSDGRRYISCNDFSFGGYGEKGIITNLILEKHCELPSKWKRMGFLWNNSYDEWIDVFKKLNFSINITRQPSQEYIDEYTGEVFDYSVLYAIFEAFSPRWNYVI